ncbi:MAG TPA: hypothetical protein VJP80_06510 [Candidatus Saccharimonadales bacterium]|nr:hypothetical protein [Candidatus Saccharimonadales bacterium]
MRIDKPLKLAGITLANPLMNGAYIGSKTLRDIELLANAQSGAVVVGSISVRPRARNPGRGYWLHKERLYALNSYGLPNGGMPYFKRVLPEMVRRVHAKSKPLIANVVGFSKEEFVPLIRLAEESGVDMAELNFGCPNVWDNGTQKAILSYDPKLMQETLRYIRSAAPAIPLCVKLSPLPPDILQEVAQVITDSDVVRAVTATNSYPNGALNSGTRVDIEEALAGLTGRSLKPISLGVVTQLRALLPRHIAIIGSGGVSSANDVQDYLAAGAAAVQLATALVEDGPSVFEKIHYQATKRKM